MPKKLFFYHIIQKSRCFEVERRFLKSLKMLHDCLVFEAKQSAGTELAAVLILPAPSREFLVELQKTFCGLNYDPWRIAAGQSNTK